MATALKTVIQITDGGKLLINNTETRNSVGDARQLEQISVGTVEETWNLATDITGDVYEFAIVNESPTNYIELGFATGVYPIRIRKGGAGTFGLDPAETQLFLRANTAACQATIYAHKV